MFFATDADSQAKALHLCRRDCAVLDDCRAYAKRTKPEFGVITGATPTERRRQRRQQAD
ncbi:MAG: WhiB family transcriptional regulator [Actinobacteria bacterium]|nr:WhiB family transcriptional regulator [Actinomycetota bacterium]